MPFGFGVDVHYYGLGRLIGVLVLAGYAGTGQMVGIASAVEGACVEQLLEGLLRH